MTQDKALVKLYSYNWETYNRLTKLVWILGGRLETNAKIYIQ
jgi:hypothetical protein